MAKSDKLIRGIRQIFEINRTRVRSKIGMCSIGRHLSCLIMTKQWLDGSELNFEGKNDTPNEK